MNPTQSHIERQYPRAPRLGVGAFVTHEDAVLLVQRGRPPGKGLWALPGGTVRLGETLRQATEREVREETGVRIRAGEPFYVFDFIERDADARILYHYVIVDIRGHYLEGVPRGADDALDARWVQRADLPSLRISRETEKLLELVGFRAPPTAEAP